MDIDDLDENASFDSVLATNIHCRNQTSNLRN